MVELAERFRSALSRTSDGSIDGVVSPPPQKINRTASPIPFSPRPPASSIHNPIRVKAWGGVQDVLHGGSL